MFMTLPSCEDAALCAPTKDSLETFIEHPLFPFLVLLRIDNFGPKKFQLCFDLICKHGVNFFAKHDLHRELGLKESIRDALSWVNNDLNKFSSHETNLVIRGAIEDLKWESQSDNHILLFNNPDFPKQLKEIYDCPALIFVKGNYELLSKRQLAMVGSRRPSREGSLNARAFAQHLVEQGWVVSSGLASGIDTYSHEGALIAGNESTVAVLAHGLDAVYPKRNQQLAQRIVESRGALVSEFPIGVLPRPEFFPRRNRIISGLSSGVLVVEAACKSGSLITAYSALEQSRDVFAIPGSIHNPMAKGCHELIRQGANLVETSLDIDVHYQWYYQSKENEKKSKAKKEIPTKEEHDVLNAIQHNELTANEISSLLNVGINDVSSLLMLMEIKGLITQGNRGFLKKH